MESRPVEILCLREIPKNLLISECYRLIQVCLFTTVVLKVWFWGPWKIPKTFQEVKEVKTLLIQRGYFPFSASFFHRSTAECSREPRMCDDTTILMVNRRYPCVFSGFTFFLLLVSIIISASRHNSREQKLFGDLNNL